MAAFKTADTYRPTGDQPQAIEDIHAAYLRAGADLVVSYWTKELAEWL